ncbi:C-type lectin domain family 18 member A-like [Haliotis rufescens]|uniref:C-type lectin domain family 18 member A-like n=1 Tax=Haliotis rufescens TaxID=6454 RepID=UPI00201F4FF6|nr:C-type lectin domain family 18 member A-like [Haliotis rufescens]
MMLLKALVFISLSLTVSGEYFFLPPKVKYEAAVYVCKQNGLKLVNVKTNETQRLVSAYMGERNVNLWTGLHYNASMSKFQWGDGEILHSPGVLTWRDGQPDLSQGMKCVVMNPSHSPFIYDMSACNASQALLCDGEETLDLLPKWLYIVRYTKRNSTELGFCESNRGGYPECVFERRGISGQVLSRGLVDAMEECALSCKDNESCIYFIFINFKNLRGECVYHTQIPG